MKQVNIMRGDAVAGTITLIDPELRVVVVEGVKVEGVKVDEANELPTRMLYKGQRVRNLRTDDKYVKRGATGMVDEDSIVPFVIWDSPDMLTDEGQRKNRTRPKESKYLEVIEEVKEEPKRTTTWANATSRKPDYSHLIGKWVKCIDGGNRLFGKWFKIQRIGHSGDPLLEHCDLLSGYFTGIGGGYPFFKSLFDLSNPRDTNPDDLPDEVKIPFDYERWKAGDFVRVETENGCEVKKLTDFEVGNYPMVAILGNKKAFWNHKGEHIFSEIRKSYLTLIVKNPDKP